MRGITRCLPCRLEETIPSMTSSFQPHRVWDGACGVIRESQRRLKDRIKLPNASLYSVSFPTTPRQAFHGRGTTIAPVPAYWSLTDDNDPPVDSLMPVNYDHFAHFHGYCTHFDGHWAVAAISGSIRFRERVFSRDDYSN